MPASVVMLQTELVSKIIIHSETVLFHPSIVIAFSKSQYVVSNAPVLLCMSIALNYHMHSMIGLMASLHADSKIAHQW